ncbi:IMP dehydrogenase [Chloroflexota bacterium]
MPGYIPADLTFDRIDLKTPLTRYQKSEQADALFLNLPLVTAAMQAVTGSKMAIAAAREGGLGAIYCSQTPEQEASMVKMAKQSKAGFVVAEAVSPEAKIKYLLGRIKETGYTKFPVTIGGKTDGELLGLITDNDYDEEMHINVTVAERMVSLSQLSVAYDDEIQGNIKKANLRIREGHHSVLPIVNRSDNSLKHLVFRKDLIEHEKNILETLDSEKRYRVGAALNTRDYRTRVPLLIDAGADVLLIDTSQGWTDYQSEVFGYIAREFPGIPFVAGNIVTADGFRFLVENGAYAVKVGMGSGSICTTLEHIGIGRAQATAVFEVVTARNAYFKETGIYIPVISDGGVEIPKDIVVALALGADAVMCGKFFAGCTESNTEINYKHKPPAKPYWGEGSERARTWRAARYDRLDSNQYDFEEGVEGWVDFVGPLKDYMGKSIQVMKDAIRKAGCRNIQELHQKATLELVSELAKKEGGVHGIMLSGGTTK